MRGAGPQASSHCRDAARLGRTGRIAADERDLHLRRVGRPDGASRRHVQWHGPGRYPGQGIVGPFGQAEYELGRDGGAQPGRQRAAVAGEDDGQPGRRGRAQQSREHFDAVPGVVLLGCCDEGFPAVEQAQHEGDRKAGDPRLGYRTDATLDEPCLAAGNLGIQAPQERRSQVERLAHRRCAAVRKFGDGTQRAAGAVE